MWPEYTYLDEPRMCSPSVNDAPLNPLQWAATRSTLPEQLIQTTPRRAATILWVLRERDRPLHTVRLHPLRSLLRQWVRVPECSVILMWCCFGM